MWVPSPSWASLPALALSLLCSPFKPTGILGHSLPWAFSPFVSPSLRPGREVRGRLHRLRSVNSMVVVVAMMMTFILLLLLVITIIIINNNNNNNNNISSSIGWRVWRKKQASIHRAIIRCGSCGWDVKPMMIGRGLSLICGAIQRPSEELDKLSLA